jgi:hypothetical protein
MSKRKPRPTHIYREEVTAPGDPLRNYTRQTFKGDDYEQWKIGARESTLGHEVKFYVGQITWREDGEVKGASDD